jgi:uncharacterized membrane protein YedE/YeeE
LIAEESLMTFWTFVFFFFLLVFAIPLSEIWTKHIQRSRTYSRKYAEDVESLHDEVARLRERTEVLEAIVTDRRFSLQQEFNVLERNGSQARAQPDRAP